MKVLTYDSNESNHVRRSVLMKNTNIFALAAGMGSLVFASGAMADLSVSLVSQGDSAYGAGHIYQLVIGGLADGDRIDAVYGNADAVLNIESTSSFYQNMFGTESSMGVNPALLAVFPSLADDSFVTIGAMTAAGNNLNTIGVDFSGFNAGGALTTDNGSWFVTPDDAQGAAVNGEVVIGQFTVAGGTGDMYADFSAAVVSVQGTINGETVNFTGDALAPIPAPGAIALLGVAGLVSRRRRK